MASLHPTVQREFPATRPSILTALADPDADIRRAAGDLVARAYWEPIASTLRTRWRLERADAEDLTQEFFAEALAKEWLNRFDPEQARFRSFLRMCVDRFVAKSRTAATRLKRGGDLVIVSLDDANALPANADHDADAHFRQEWIRSVFALALDALRTEAHLAGKDVHVELFEAYDIADYPGCTRPGYRELAARFGLSETTVTNHLAWARRTFRRHVLDVLRSLSASDAEFRDDVRELLGIDAS
ncbi:MAG: sigma-70 family RNA polymerase sigma factor [Gemmatimonadota bacterium]